MNPIMRRKSRTFERGRGLDADSATLPLKLSLFFFLLMAPTWLYADVLSGTVQDPSGAVIPGAQIEVTGENLARSVLFMSDGLGRFVSPDLKSGTYSVRVTRDGF